MYGLINISIKKLIIGNFGSEKWAEVVSSAELEDDLFISNKTYDDKITYQLISAAAKVLKTPPEQILKEFGRYWVLEVAPKGYGKLLDAGGKTFQEFMLNLPNFHSRIMLIYPQVKPPHFEVSAIDTKTLQLMYGSDREGLLPFVLGLIDGLATRFSVKVAIDYKGSANPVGLHEFILKEQS